jgi:hypothetical protein
LSGQLFSILTPGALEGLPVLHCARRTGQTGAAGVQAAEFADKANIEPVFAAVTQNAIVVAGRCVLSKQVLNTQSAIARTVGSHLRAPFTSQPVLYSPAERLRWGGHSRASSPWRTRARP